MKKLLLLLALIALPFSAQAQTPGAQPEFCVTSPSQTANYNQLCISASTSGGTIGITNFGSATGDINVLPGTGSLTILDTSPPGIIIAGQAGTYPAVNPSGILFQIVGGAGAVTGFQIDAFSAIANSIHERANGTLASPTALLAGDIMGNVVFRGYQGSNGYAGNAAVIRGIAVTNWSNTNNDSAMIFLTIPTGSTGAGGGLTQGMALYQGLIVGTISTDPGAGSLRATGTVRADTKFNINGTDGASCTLTTVAHLTVVNGIVTLCN